MSDKRVIIGLDCGGSLSKMVVLSTFQLQFASLEQYSKTTIDQQQLYISTALIDEIIVYLSAFKAYLSVHISTIQVGLTGCGGVKYLQSIKNIFEQSQYVNQFQANPQGLHIYDRIGMKVNLHSFVQQENSQIQYIKQQNQKISEINSNFMFISLGSGVNFQKFGFSQNGIQRKKVDDPSTSYDGYSLGGSCLGAAYLIGLVAVLSNEPKKQDIVQLIKQDALSGQIYNMVIVNLMEHAINLSIIHNLDCIVIAGNIFKLKGYVHQQFRAAFKSNHNHIPLKRCLLELNDLGGLIGALGAIYKFI